jgi:hypothetical protein
MGTPGSSDLLTMRVIPRASRSGVDGMRDGAIVVRLNAPPVDGAANQALIDVLATALDVPRRAVTIVSGERARLKRVRVDGMTIDTAMRRLGLLLVLLVLTGIGLGAPWPRGVAHESMHRDGVGRRRNQEARGEEAVRPLLYLR